MMSNGLKYVLSSKRPFADVFMELYATAQVNSSVPLREGKEQNPVLWVLKCHAVNNNVVQFQFIVSYWLSLNKQAFKFPHTLSELCISKDSTKSPRDRKLLPDPCFQPIGCHSKPHYPHVIFTSQYFLTQT